MKLQILEGLVAKLTGFLKQNRLNKLEEEKARILEELKIAESKFLQHKISEDFYKKLTNEKNKRLIVIETQIEITKIEDRLKKYSEDISKLNPRRRVLVKKLFERKDIILREISKAQNAYFTRKMDEKGYKDFTNDKQSELISVEAEINRLYKEEAKDIIREAEKRMSMDEVKELEIKADNMASDIVEQLPYGYGTRLGEGKEDAGERINRRKVMHERDKA